MQNSKTFLILIFCLLLNFFVECKLLPNECQNEYQLSQLQLQIQIDNLKKEISDFKEYTDATFDNIVVLFRLYDAEKEKTEKEYYSMIQDIVKSEMDNTYKGLLNEKNQHETECAE
jgi:hypothetical protein